MTRTEAKLETLVKSRSGNFPALYAACLSIILVPRDFLLFILLADFFNSGVTIRNR